MTNIQLATQEEAPRAELTALAWGAILIGSMAPTIILRLFARGVPAEPLMPSWLGWAQVVVLTVLWAVTWVWPDVKPLRCFVLVVLASSIGASFTSPFVLESAAWSNWMQQASGG